MKTLGQILRKKHRDPQGPGLPRGLLMEIRAIFFLGWLILAGFAVWWGMQQLEKREYLGADWMERLPTAPGPKASP